ASASKTINSNPSSPFTSFNCLHFLRSNSLNCFKPDRSGNSLIDSQPDIYRVANDSNLPSPWTSVDCVHPLTSIAFNFRRLERSGNLLIDRHPSIDSNSNDSNVLRPVTSISSWQESMNNSLRFLRLEMSGNCVRDIPDKNRFVSLVNMESEDGTVSVVNFPINAKNCNFSME
ncbi:hypothetical protein LINGRAHAP2_LOCUS31806, partial [Linum grandiflorum]